jgi:hypothetical protein
MRKCLIAAVILAIPSVSPAAERCFSRSSEPSWTITDEGTAIGDMVMKRDGRTVVMSTSGGGTGIEARVATEADGTEHLYLHVGDTLVMDMVPFELGCPGGHSWTDVGCSRVLISQVDAYARTALFYYLERGHPITDCKLPAPLKEGAIVDLQCSSGTKLKLDATEYPKLAIDGVELQLYDGDLPCAGLTTSP